MREESIVVEALYGTAIGRRILKRIVSPGLSIAASGFLNTRISSLGVPLFVKKNRIDLSDYEVPETGYASFNDFFKRKKKKGAVQIKNGLVISPCDALLTICRIKEDSVFHIKHTSYSLAELLKDDSLAERFTGGTAYVFRLTPAHYHRYVYCSSGTVVRQRSISGILHSVKPICHEKFDVFIQNTRKYQVIKNKTAGFIVQMEVGALLVGKISNHKKKKNARCVAGEEKGYFEYGGSSILVLVQEGYETCGSLLNAKKINGEIPVQMGEVIVAG